MSCLTAIAVMRHGRIECIDTPSGVYNRPPNSFVCAFVGEANIFECEVMSVEDGSATLRRDELQFRVDCPAGLRKGQKLSVAIRPENIALQRISQRADQATKAVVNDAIFKGSQISYLVTAGDQQLHVLTLPPLDGQPLVRAILSA